MTVSEHYQKRMTGTAVTSAADAIDEIHEIVGKI